MAKRILSIFLCVLLALSFAACGEAPQTATGGSDDTVVTITSDSDGSEGTDGTSDGASDSSTDSVTDSSSDGSTDNVTDSASSESEREDLSDDVIDVAPGGDDMGGGDTSSSDGSTSSDVVTGTTDTNTDTGIWGDDTSTDSSEGTVSNSDSSGGSSSSGQSSTSGGSSSSNYDSDLDIGDDGETSDTPLWSDTDNGSSDGPSGGGDSDSDNSDDDSEEAVDITVGRKFITTDITNHGIVVYDLDACNGAYTQLTNDSVSVFWEWTYAEDPNGWLKGPSLGIDAAKLRYSAYYKRDVVIACSSSGWAGVIDYKECTLLWESEVSDLSNAHSIEMMPNGDLVVAVSKERSTGKNGLLYFPLSATRSQAPVSGIVCDSAHGVSWDPQNECLWVLNNKEVFAVTVENPGRNGVLQVVEDSVVDGFSGGHAFSPVAGSPGKYWIGAGNNVYQFDTATKTVTQSSDILQQPNVKGIASFTDGTVVFAAGNIHGNCTKGWSSDGFRIVTADGESVDVVFDPSVREFYKVQPFTRAYQ